MAQNVETILFLMLPDDGSYKPGAKAFHKHAGHMHETHGSRKRRFKPLGGQNNARKEMMIGKNLSNHL